MRSRINPEDLPGGRRDRTNPDAPKTIVSKDLLSFVYEGALSGYDGCHFSLARHDDGALCTGWGQRDGVVFNLEFMAALSSLDALQAVIDEYGLANVNGINIQVNGLPPYLGDFLVARYASGEEIFATNNQSPLIRQDARLALFRFFSDLADEAGSGFDTE
ncbi:MAG: hypothetical protein PHO66_05505 [Eubacteriales bacterium]|nr:hypothetical protein [Eubacteriales bacterium]